MIHSTVFDDLVRKLIYRFPYVLQNCTKDAGADTPWGVNTANTPVGCRDELTTPELAGLTRQVHGLVFLFSCPDDFVDGLIFLFDDIVFRRFNEPRHTTKPLYAPLYSLSAASPSQAYPGHTEILCLLIGFHPPLGLAPVLHLHTHRPSLYPPACL